MFACSVNKMDKGEEEAMFWTLAQFCMTWSCKWRKNSVDNIIQVVIFVPILGCLFVTLVVKRGVLFSFYFLVWLVCWIYLSYWMIYLVSVLPLVTWISGLVKMDLLLISRCDLIPLLNLFRIEIMRSECWTRVMLTYFVLFSFKMKNHIRQCYKKEPY